MNTRKRWCTDEGSLDMIQLVIGMLIVAIAAVGSYQALFFGTTQLDAEMRYRKAIALARSYAEYWQGRIHIDFPQFDDPRRPHTIAGNLTDRITVVLDKRDPSTTEDDVNATIAYRRLEEVYRESNPSEILYWRIRVIVRWEEPTIGKATGRFSNAWREIEFIAGMAHASS